VLLDQREDRKNLGVDTGGIVIEIKAEAMCSQQVDSVSGNITFFLEFMCIMFLMNTYIGISIFTPELLYHHCRFALSSKLACWVNSGL
jgi:hypothetical protein